MTEILVVVADRRIMARSGTIGTGRLTFVYDDGCRSMDALRNSFITVAERELMLPPSLTKRLVNHARPNDVTEGYAADWTVAQLRELAQNIADRIEALMCGLETR